MRLNQFIAHHTSLSRRAADKAIEAGRVSINGRVAVLGQPFMENDSVALDNRPITSQVMTQTILFNKPVGYVCSRDGQGSKTIYDLLPPELHNLNPIGRLDKDSSGLLLLTNDGQLANELTHPRYEKTKIYEVELDHPIQPLHQQMISDKGLMLEDGVSKLQLEKVDEAGKQIRVIMHEGRNRQIRRTFAPLGYRVTKLHRTHFGKYALDNIPSGKTTVLK
jgi:23S rRNA pseudouridine2605 synthase